MADLDLDAVKFVLASYEESTDTDEQDALANELVEDVPALVAEVERLRAEREGLAAAVPALIAEAVKWNSLAYDQSYSAADVIDDVPEPHRSLLRAILDAARAASGEGDRG